MWGGARKITNDDVGWRRDSFNRAKERCAYGFERGCKYIKGIIICYYRSKMIICGIKQGFLAV